LTFRALGRIHIELKTITILKKILNALFLLNSRIPLVSNSSKLEVNEHTKW